MIGGQNNEIHSYHIVQDVTISLWRANMYGIAFALLTGIVFWYPFISVWSWNYITLQFHSFPSVLFLSSLLALILVHEVLHGMGFYFFGNVQRTHIRFGFQWKSFTPYAHCSEPMRSRAYRIALLLPMLLLGIIPSIISLILGNVFLAALGFIMIAAAGGDAAILLSIRKIAPDVLVLDHPKRAGCLIVQVTHQTADQS